MDSLFNRRVGRHLNFEKYVRDLIKSNHSQALIVFKDSYVVAYSIAQISKRIAGFQPEKYGFISDMVVKQSYQRKSIGEQMERHHGRRQKCAYHTR
jgi:ribosomal protein S18 acetylase RimI-like enzyme